MAKKKTTKKKATKRTAKKTVKKAAKKTTKKAAPKKSVKDVATVPPPPEAAAAEDPRVAELEARVTELESQLEAAVSAATEKAEALRGAGERADGLKADLKAARADAKAAVKAAARVPSLETEVRELRTANGSLKSENRLLVETETRLEGELEAANQLLEEAMSAPAGISEEELEHRITATKVAVEAAVRAEAERAIEATYAKARAKMQDLRNQLKAAESRLRMQDGGAGERTYTREEVELHVRRMEQSCRVESERALAATEKAARDEIDRLKAQVSRRQGG